MQESKNEVILFVSEDGNDSGDGSQNAPFESVNAALKTLAGKKYDKAEIVIAGTITEIADISGMVVLKDEYPPLLFRGASPKRKGILNAGGLERRVLFIDSGNTITLGADLVLTGGFDAQGGSGVCVNEGHLILDGATITKNETKFGLCGGVYVGKDADFIMYRGSIVKNRSQFNGGGVFSDDGGSFTMYGGTIAENSALISGGGVFVGVDSAFTMHGGVIEDNRSGDKQGMTMGSMEVRCGKGGGVFVCERAVFAMHKGEIRGNRVISPQIGNESGSGGGIFVQPNGLCTIEEGIILKNSAVNFGGGVFAGGKVKFRGSIRGNKAECGGGVCVEGKRGLFIMENGVIGNNSGVNGGGVSIIESGEFRMESGECIGNYGTAAGTVYVLEGTATFQGKTIQGVPNSKVPDVVLYEKGNFIFAGGELKAKVVGLIPGTFKDVRKKT
jgi:hypothetical protein